MADCRLTHVENFSQEFSYPIPILKERMVWRHAFLKRDSRTFAVIFVTSDEELARERLDHDQRWGLPPNHSCFSLNIP